MESSAIFRDDSVLLQYQAMTQPGLLARLNRNHELEDAHRHELQACGFSPETGAAVIMLPNAHNVFRPWLRLGLVGAILAGRQDIADFELRETGRTDMLDLPLVDLSFKVRRQYRRGGGFVLEQGELYPCQCRNRGLLEPVATIFQWRALIDDLHFILAPLLGVEATKG